MVFGTLKFPLQALHAPIVPHRLESFGSEENWMKPCLTSTLLWPISVSVLQSLSMFSNLPLRLFFILTLSSALTFAIFWATFVYDYDSLISMRPFSLTLPLILILFRPILFAKFPDPVQGSASLFNLALHFLFIFSSTEASLATDRPRNLFSFGIDSKILWLFGKLLL